MHKQLRWLGLLDTLPTHRYFASREQTVSECDPILLKWQRSLRPPLLLQTEIFDRAKRPLAGEEAIREELQLQEAENCRGRKGPEPIDDCCAPPHQRRPGWQRLVGSWGAWPDEAPGVAVEMASDPSPPGGRTAEAPAGSEARRPMSRMQSWRVAESALPQYQGKKDLGAGSFARVLLMEHRATGHQVAVKMLKKERLAEERMEDKVRREIDIMLRLRHPNIIRLYRAIDTPR